MIKDTNDPVRSMFLEHAATQAGMTDEEAEKILNMGGELLKDLGDVDVKNMSNGELAAILFEKMQGTLKGVMPDWLKDAVARNAGSVDHSDNLPIDAITSALRGDFTKVASGYSGNSLIKGILKLLSESPKIATFAVNYLIGDSLDGIRAEITANQQDANQQDGNTEDAVAVGQQAPALVGG